MEKITSLQNMLIKHAQALREASERRKEGMTIIDGSREIKRAFEAGIILDKVFYVEGRQNSLLKQLLTKKVEVIEVSDKVMEKLAYGERHEGIVALAKTPLLALKDLKLSNQPLVVVLESLEKPGNLGAILRTCDGVGVEAVLVCDPKTDMYNPNVIRSSTGVIFSLPVVCVSSEEIFSFLKSRKIKICASQPAAPKLYTQAVFQGAWALVLGSEDRGLSDFWLMAADMTVKVPMKGKADSLNVSTSAAIILYEALRQRTT
jgi:TrmH family RNA methyltransferase